jgi:hypothetical protein
LLPVPDTGRSDDHREQEPLDVHRDMPFPSVDLIITGVEPARGAADS